MQQRSKWHNPKRNLHPDDLVIIVDDTAPRSSWLMGRVVKALPGPGGLVRSVLVKTKSSILQRPIDKLCLLLEAGDWVWWSRDCEQKHTPAHIPPEPWVSHFPYMHAHISLTFEPLIAHEFMHGFPRITFPQRITFLFHGLLFSSQGLDYNELWITRNYDLWTLMGYEVYAVFVYLWNCLLWLLI